MCSILQGAPFLSPEEKYEFLLTTWQQAHEYEAINIVSNRESRAPKRVSLMSIGINDVRSDADYGDMLNDLIRNKRSLRFERSPIHGWGVFSNEPFEAGYPIIELMGEIIRLTDIEERLDDYKSDGLYTHFIFRLDDQTYLDQTKVTTISKFFNHSCKPNCDFKVVTYRGQIRTIVYARRDISPGEELTIDYKLPNTKLPLSIPCNCGDPNCCGYINYNRNPDASWHQVIEKSQDSKGKKSEKEKKKKDDKEYKEKPAKEPTTPKRERGGRGNRRQKAEDHHPLMPSPIMIPGDETESDDYQEEIQFDDPPQSPNIALEAKAQFDLLAAFLRTMRED